MAGGVNGGSRAAPRHDPARSCPMLAAGGGAGSGTRPRSRTQDPVVIRLTFSQPLVLSVAISDGPWDPGSPCAARKTGGSESHGRMDHPENEPALQRLTFGYHGRLQPRAATIADGDHRGRSPLRTPRSGRSLPRLLLSQRSPSRAPVSRRSRSRLLPSQLSPSRAPLSRPSASWAPLLSRLLPSQPSLAQTLLSRRSAPWTPLLSRLLPSQPSSLQTLLSRRSASRAALLWPPSGSWRSRSMTIAGVCARQRRNLRYRFPTPPGCRRPGRSRGCADGQPLVSSIGAEGPRPVVRPARS